MLEKRPPWKTVIGGHLDSENEASLNSEKWLTTESYSVRNLKECTDYQFRIRARNHHCNGLFSEYLKLRTKCPPPLPPQL